MDDRSALGASSLDPGDPWPCCPSCHKPRQAMCHYCGTSGDGFSLPDPAVTPGDADENSEAPRQYTWIVCGLCDELLADRFLRRCEWCGHDFGDGLDFDAPEIREEIREIFTGRVVFTAIVLLASLLLSAIYFAVLLRL